MGDTHASDVQMVANFAAGPSDDKSAVICEMTLENGKMVGMILSKDAAVGMARLILNAITLESVPGRTG